MAQSLAKIVVHIVFGTKGRRPWLTSGIRPQVYAYLAGVLKNIDCVPMLVGGMDDHVHILCVLSRN